MLHQNAWPAQAYRSHKHGAFIRSSFSHVLAKVKVFFTQLSTVGESAGLEPLLDQALQAAAAGQEPRWDSVGEAHVSC